MSVFDHIQNTKEILRRMENCRRSGDKVLDLSNLYITELPAGIEGFENLVELDVSYNQLLSLPDWIGKLRSLKKLNLRHCGLTALPDSIKNLSNLRTFYIGANCLPVLPEWLGGFALLEELDIGANELYTIPDFIGNLKNLRVLDLGYTGEWKNQTRNHDRSNLDEQINELDSLPDFLTELPRLLRLDLGHTKLKTLPEKLRALRLESLKLGNNELTKIPVWLGAMTSLRELDLSGNRKLKSLPRGLNMLRDLETLNISETSIGKVPECGLENFQILNVLT